MNALFRTKWMPLTIQLIMLFAFVLILSGAFGISGTEPAYLKILRNTNLANLLVWGYWWPIIIIVAVLLGRWWCTACPVELLNSLASMAGLKQKPGRFMRSGWIISIFYAVILILIVESLWAHRIPHRMAWYLSGLAIVAVITGLVWEKRSFCNYICPVGHLLGLYSKFSFFRLKPGNKELCRNCKTKDCFAPGLQYRLNGRSCTSELNPSANTDSIRCINCTHCMSACPYGNLAFRYDNPLKRLRNGISLNHAQSAFLILIIGFLCVELLEDLKPVYHALTALPEKISSSLHAGIFSRRLIESVCLYLVYPFAFAGLTALANRLFFRQDWGRTFRYLAVFLLPLLAFLHAYKGLTKMIKRLPWLQEAVKAPTGEDTARAIQEGSLQLQTDIAQKGMEIAAWLGPVTVFLAAGIFVFIWYRNYRQSSAMIPAIAAFSIYVFFALSLIALI